MDQNSKILLVNYKSWILQLNFLEKHFDKKMAKGEKERGKEEEGGKGKEKGEGGRKRKRQSVLRPEVVAKYRRLDKKIKHGEVLSHILSLSLSRSMIPDHLFRFGTRNCVRV